jgi:hypothetical protein
MIAYLGNWQSCPSMSEVAAYSHIVIAFAVSYTWSPSKNNCSPTCEISEPLICNNSPNPGLVSQWQAAGKKVILSFGGAGMGGSWAGDPNDCWDYCYGRETQVTNRLVQIVNDMGLDGVDLDFEYHVTPQAVSFLNTVTTGLKNQLPAGSEITHAPMDSDIIPGKPYFDDVLKVTGHQLDFLMPQYYNGITRPVIDGISNSGAGNSAALSHYTTIVNEIYGGDPKRMVFGFCISDCSGTGSNANSAQAATAMTDLAQSYPCNGGAFFWVAEHDFGGAWSSTVSSAMNSVRQCSISPSTPAPNPTEPPFPNPTEPPIPNPTEPPVTNPTEPPAPVPTLAPLPDPTPVPTPSPTPAPTLSPPSPTSTGSPSMCCNEGENKMKAINGCTQYYQCVWGEVVPTLVGPVGNGALFDESIQNWNWPQTFECQEDTCGGGEPPIVTTPAPTPAPTSTPGSEPCCPTGFTGYKAWNNCFQYYYCVNGVPTDPLNVPGGTRWDENANNFVWDSATFQCSMSGCGSRRLRGKQSNRK